MYSQTNKSIGRIRDLNNQLKQKAIDEGNPRKLKLRSLQTNVGLGSVRHKKFTVESPQKRKSFVVNIDDRGSATPIKFGSPLQKKLSIRLNSSSNKTQIHSANTSFFGSTRNPLRLISPLGELEEIKSTQNEESREDLFNKSRKFFKQNIIKPEVTISEHDISKKWYEYELKIGRELKLPLSSVNKGSYSPDKSTQSTTLSLSGPFNILGNLKIQKKGSASLNPLVNPAKPNLRHTMYDGGLYPLEEIKMVKPKVLKTNLLSIRQYSIPNKTTYPAKCCNCDPHDYE